MIKLGIIGYPLSHSLSPVMHKAVLQELELEGGYEILETHSDKLKEQVEFLKSTGFKGFNITIPHKVAIIDFLNEIDGYAQKVGAVNTVVIDENKNLKGYNTDVYGFAQAIPGEVRSGLAEKRAAILGSGGAARAVISGIYELGIKQIDIIARNKNKSEELIRIFKSNYSDLQMNFLQLTENIDLSDISLIVNTTPLGMQGEHEGISPLSVYSIDSLPKNAFVYDIVYRPGKTKLLELAEKRGLKVLNGLDMLILQGAKGFHIWTGREPNIETMKNAVLSVL